MYQAYWGLTESPFRGHLDPRYFYKGPTQDEALARLHFLVEERRSLGLLLGDPGAGKSLLLEVFARELGQVRRQRAVLSLIGSSRRDFLWTISGQLGVEINASASEFALARALSDHLIANRYQQVSTVLLLDDADAAPGEVLDEIARLVQVNQTGDPRLTFVLATRAADLFNLGSRVLELAELRVDLDAWDEDDTAEFLKHSLAIVGRTSTVFSDSAVHRVHELSGGIPRRIKQLADLALLAAAAANQGQIESETIEAVFLELNILPPLAATGR